MPCAPARSTGSSRLPRGSTTSCSPRWRLQASHRAGQPSRGGREPAIGRARRSDGHPLGGRARGRARASPDRHVGGPQDLSTGHQRHLGFVEACAPPARRRSAPDVRFSRAFTEADGARACPELLDAHPDVTAIVAANDLIALGCYDVLRTRARLPRRHLGRRIQRHAVRRPFSPPLTTFVYPPRDRNRRGRPDAPAADRRGERGALRSCSTPSLVVRGSTAPPGRDEVWGSGRRAS